MVDAPVLGFVFTLGSAGTGLSAVVKFRRVTVEGRCVCHGLQTLDLFTSVALTRFFTFHLQAPAENLSLFSSLSFFFFFSLIPVGVSV